MTRALRSQNSQKTVAEGETKTMRAKKSMETKDKANVPREDGRRKVLTRGSEIASEKGNMTTGRKALEAIGAPVLRDRTNLPRERLKVDLLLKKGASDGGLVNKVSVPLTRVRTATRAAKNADENTKPAISTRKTRNKIEKKESQEASPSSEDPKIQKDNSKGSKDEDGKKETIKSGISTRGSTKTAAFNVDSSENEKETISAKSTRKVSQSIPVQRGSLRSSDGTSKNSTNKDLSKKSDDKTETATRVSKRVALRNRSSAAKAASENAKNTLEKPSKDTASGSNVANSTLVPRKFFKNKALLNKMGKISPIKQTVVAKRTGNRQKMSTSFRMRQTTLGESFAKQTTKKVLRKRPKPVNYCEEPDKTDNVDSETMPTKKIGPVYKIGQLEDNTSANVKKGDEYEFQFDKDDSRERLRKKPRKKAVRKKAPTKEAKTTRKKVNTATVTTKNAEEPAPKEPIVKPKETEEKMVEEQPGEMQQGSEGQSIAHEPMEVDEISPVAENPSIVSINEVESSTIVTQPKIRKNELLKGQERISLTVTPQLATGFVKKSADSSDGEPQYKAMTSHVLLNKSISPISKAAKNFDPGSPWRPPVLTANYQFSRVKNVVQSTPHIPNVGGVKKVAGKILRTQDLPQNPGARMNKILKENENNENSSEIFEGSPKKSAPLVGSPRKPLEASKSPRKFGTVISNVNTDRLTPKGPINVISNRSRDISLSLQKTVLLEDLSKYKRAVLSKKDEAPIADGGKTMDSIEEETIVDKENSPLKKSPTKNSNKSPQKTYANKSPLKIISTKILSAQNISHSPEKVPIVTQDHEPLPTTLERILKTPEKVAFVAHEYEPQPSTSKNVSICDESTQILRQSNLNSFLNIDEVPTHSKISTPHGIFDDPCSPTRSGLPTLLRKTPTVENAFGFEEDVAEEENVMSDRSPISKAPAAKPLPRGEKGTEKTMVDIPARVSIGEIKRKLLPTRVNSKETETKASEIIEIVDENRVTETSDDRMKIPDNRRDFDDASKFADTFDLLEEIGQSDDQAVKEIPLFVDLEPPHFKQAPRYSYKRKRVPVLRFSDDDDQDENDFQAECRPKKRKMSKVEKERKKQIDNWAKDINQTFEEIEEFDLVVE